MARFIIIETKKHFDELLDDNVRFPLGVHVWLWDDARPGERVYIAGDSPAYEVGSLVGASGRPWGPKEDEVAFVDGAEHAAALARIGMLEVESARLQGVVTEVVDAAKQLSPVRVLPPG